MNNDKVILLGSWMCDMSWQDVFDITGKADKALWMSWHRPLANAGASMTRNTLACYGGTAPKSSLLTPFVYVPEKDAFDLYRFNPVFWASFRKMAEWCAEIGTTLMVAIGNECEQRKPDRRAQSPWYNNTQGISDMYDRGTYPIWRALTKKVLDTLAGLDVCYEPINEGNATKALDVTEIIIEELFNAGVPSNRISLGAQMIQCEFMGYHLPWDQQYVCANKFTNQEYIGKQVDRLYGAHRRNDCWYPIHGILNPAERTDRPFGEKWTQAREWWVEHIGNSVRLFLSSDGAEKTPGTFNGRPPGERWAAAIRDMLEVGRRNILIGGNPKFAFEIFQQGVPPAEFAAIVAQAADAIEGMGYPLANRGKFPEPPPPPPPVDPPPVVPPVTPPEHPAPVKHSAWYLLIPRLSRRFPFIHINFRRWWLTLTGRA
jgi:hypothetical protein